MYIADKYWNNYIGDTDDSLTLVEYLAAKHKETISLQEIFSDIGFKQLNGNFRQHDEPLTGTLGNADSENAETDVEFYYAIDLITDLAAILLECKVNGSVNLCELSGFDLDTPTPVVCLTSTQNEDEIIKNALTDFVSAPLTYDLSEMCPKEDMLEMVEICKNLLKELYGV